MQARGFIRIHLSTFLFAVLATSVVLGLNLQSRRQISYAVFDRVPFQQTPESHANPGSYYMSSTEWRGCGWPYQLAYFSGRKDIELPQAELKPEFRKEWESLPVNSHPTGCMEVSLDETTFNRDAPQLLHYFKTKNPSYTYAQWNYDIGDVVQYICGYFALLFTAMVFVEWRVRARARSAVSPA